MRTTTVGGANDMDLVTSVLKSAIADGGYVLIGPGPQVYRDKGRREIEPVPRYEAEMVRQLLDSQMLREGRSAQFTHREHQGQGRRVSVPKSTRDTLARWLAYKPIPTQLGRVRKGDQ